MTQQNDPLRKDKVAKLSCSECGDDYFPDEAWEHEHKDDDWPTSGGTEIVTLDGAAGLDAMLDASSRASDTRTFSYGDRLWHATIHNDASSREDYEELDVGVFGSEKEARHAAAVALWEYRRYWRAEVVAGITPIGNPIRLSPYKAAMTWDLVLGKVYHANYMDNRSST